MERDLSEAVRDVVQNADGPMTASEVADRVGADPHPTRLCLLTLEGEGAVGSEGGGGSKEWYTDAADRMEGLATEIADMGVGAEVWGRDGIGEWFAIKAPKMSETQTRRAVRNGFVLVSDEPASTTDGSGMRIYGFRRLDALD